MSIAAIGLGVTVTQRDQNYFFRNIQFDMLNLFLSQIPHDVTFIALDVSKNSLPGFKKKVPDNHSVLILNSTSFVGLSRVAETPLVQLKTLFFLRNFSGAIVRLPSWSGIAGARACRILGIPYALSLHGHPGNSFSYKSLPFGSILKSHVEIQTIKSIQAARHTFFVGDELCATYGQFAKKTTVFANHLHDSSEVAEPKVIRQEPHRLLFVGELRPEKGIHVLLDSCKRLIQSGLSIILDFVGIGPCYKQLLSLQSQPIWKDRIILHGWLEPGSELNARFSSATLLVLPSFSEGVPKVVIEAMVRGVPVVATNLGGIRFLLGEGTRGRLVDGPSVELLERQLALALSDLDTTEQLAWNAYHWIRDFDRNHYSALIGTELRASFPSWF